MGYQNVFKRYEIKYLITKEQQALIKDKMSGYMDRDEYGKSSICNIYLDTPNYLLIRRSIEKPVYKEKLRLRSYGTAASDSMVFLELKKKYKGVVYKRRVGLQEDEAMKYLSGRGSIPDSQIARELDYFMGQYEGLRPAAIISYDREAFYEKGNRDFRLTFDENILWRDYDLSLCKGFYGASILDKGQVLMEVKTGMAMPLWLTGLLSEQGIYHTSFSKYGNAYKEIITNRQSGGIYCA